LRLICKEAAQNYLWDKIKFKESMMLDHMNAGMRKAHVLSSKRIRGLENDDYSR